MQRFRRPRPVHLPGRHLGHRAVPGAPQPAGVASVAAPGRGPVRVPPVPDVGSPLPVGCAVGPALGEEAVPLVEAVGPPVGLEGPQLESVGAAALGEGDQARADPPTGPRRVDVQLRDPGPVQEQEADHRPCRLRHPGLLPAPDHAGQPGPGAVVAAGHRGDVGHRVAAGPDEQVGHGVGIGGRRPPDGDAALAPRLHGCAPYPRPAAGSTRFRSGRGRIRYRCSVGLRASTTLRSGPAGRSATSTKPASVRKPASSGVDQHLPTVEWASSTE